MRDQWDRGGRGRGRSLPNVSNRTSQTTTSGRSGSRFGTPSSGRGRRGGGRSPATSTRLPGGGGSSGSRAAFDRGRIFNGGLQAVRYEKEKRLWKVGPPTGDQLHRFQLPAFLRGLTHFIEHQLEQRAIGQGRLGSTRGNNPVTASTGISPVAVSGDGGGGEEEGKEEAEEEEELESYRDGLSISLGEFAALALKDDDEVDTEDEEEEDAMHGEKTSCSSSSLPSPNSKESSSTSRAWWNFTSGVPQIDAVTLPRNAVATKEEEEAAAAAATAIAAAQQQRSQPQEGPLELSLRLERLDLTDIEASMLADWAETHAKNNTALIRKLWLFGNRLGDDGAAAVARILALATVTECHLSHNLITLVGAQKLLETVAVAAEHAARAELVNPLWLRLEWNRISLSGLVNVLEAQHAQHGLLCDVPEAAQEDAAPPLPTLPNYLQTAKEKKNNDKNVNPPSGADGVLQNKSGPTSAFTRSTRNQLNYIIEQCHCRLPWVSSQFETPSEAAVLLNAKNLWSSKLTDLAGTRQAKAAGGDAVASTEGVFYSKPHSDTNNSTSVSIRQTSTTLLQSSTSASLGPLLLVPDTSALLAMAGADPSVTAPTFFTLEWLLNLSTKGLFGRTLPPREQIFIIVPASVATQLDALKADSGARGAVRRFMSKGLDDMGPAGANFLTMLGAHEGEGLVLEFGAEVAGSRGADVASRGQATDHRIVEIGLYFQQECMKSATDAIDGGIESVAEEKGTGKTAQQQQEQQQNALNFQFSSLPVILLTSDNGQQALAKAHGLPAVRMTDVASARAHILGHVEAGKPLTASFLRAVLRPGATAALGKVAARSLQMEFDGAVACLRVAVEHLVLAQRREVALREALGSGLKKKDECFESDKIGVESAKEELEATQELIEALEKRLKEWDGLIRSHQVASRVLQWSTSS